jgi:hypothetical protein
MDVVAQRGFGAHLLREHAGDLAVAAAYLLAWGFGAWLPDRILLALVVAVGLQFFVVTMVLGAITPRCAGPIAACVIGHALLFAFLAWFSTGGGKGTPDWLAVAIVQAPLVVQNLQRLVQPRGAGFLLEAIGPFLLCIPVLIVAVALDAIVPDPGLAARELRFEHLAPLPGKDIAFALLAGAVYFVVGAVARTQWARLGGEEHRRADIDSATIRRWRDDYEKSRKR